jgi:hypothetical protein
MKWVTREPAKVDRIACPWLIKRFVDKDAEILFVPAHKVIEYIKGGKDKAIPFDILNVELGYHGEECSFDAIIKKYKLDQREPALNELAKLLGGPDTDNRKLTPYSECLAAIAAGFSITSKDNYDNMTKQFPLYDDALFGFCRSDHKEKLLSPRH